MEKCTGLLPQPQTLPRLSALHGSRGLTPYAPGFRSGVLGQGPLTFTWPRSAVWWFGGWGRSRYQAACGRQRSSWVRVSWVVRATRRLRPPTLRKRPILSQRPLSRLARPALAPTKKRWQYCPRVRRTRSQSPHHRPRRRRRMGLWPSRALRPLSGCPAFPAVPSSAVVTRLSEAMRCRRPRSGPRPSIWTNTR